MKTTIYNLLIVSIFFVFVGFFSSCSQMDDDYMMLNKEANDTEWTSIVATYTYNVPEEMFRYVDITVCYNNDNFTDASWEPMLNQTFTRTYNIKKEDVTAPIVLVYNCSNRLVNGINVNWDITMDLHIDYYNGSELVKTMDKHYSHIISGDAYKGINDMIANVHTRTYGIKITKGIVRLIPDEMM